MPRGVPPLSGPCGGHRGGAGAGQVGVGAAGDNEATCGLGEQRLGRDRHYAPCGLADPSIARRKHACRASLWVGGEQRHAHDISRTSTVDTCMCSKLTWRVGWRQHGVRGAHVPLHAGEKRADTLIQS